MHETNPKRRYLVIKIIKIILKNQSDIQSPEEAIKKKRKNLKLKNFIIQKEIKKIINNACFMEQQLVLHILFCPEVIFAIIFVYHHEIEAEL
jgi:hypothetical protein